MHDILRSVNHFALPYRVISEGTQMDADEQPAPFEVGSIVSFEMIQELFPPQEITVVRLQPGDKGVYGAPEGYHETRVTFESFEVRDVSNGEIALIFAPLIEGTMFGYRVSRVCDRIQVTGKGVKFVILETETTLNFASGEYVAPAGSVLWENPMDEDGYTVTPLVSFLTTYVPVRQAPGES
jgi:hypothetical protein